MVETKELMIDIIEFINNSEELLASGEFQNAAHLARTRLASIPGDVDAQIILGRALMEMGARDESSEIFLDIKIRLSKWNAMLETIAGKALPSTLNRDLDDIPEETENSPKAQFEADQDESNPVFPKEFHTITMAELFLKQGHFDMAKKVLENAVIRDPSNSAANQKLKQLEFMLGEKPPVSGERRLSLLNELERWIKKIKRR